MSETNESNGSSEKKPKKKHPKAEVPIPQMIDNVRLAKLMSIHRDTLRDWVARCDFPKPQLKRTRIMLWDAAKVAEYLKTGRWPAEDQSQVYVQPWPTRRARATAPEPKKKSEVPPTVGDHYGSRKRELLDRAKSEPKGG